MSFHRLQVQRFYREIWNNHDKSVMPEILHPRFSFRGSLGEEKSGHAGFSEYVDMVHDALSSYECHIDDMVVEPPKVFAKMTFEGKHTNTFRGFAATGKQVQWVGAALFIFDEAKIRDVWVLGDLFSLEAVLVRNQVQHASQFSALQ